MKQKNKSISLDIVPVAKPRMTQRDKWAKRPCVMKYFAFKKDIQLKANGFRLADSYSVVFYIPFPKSYNRKKKLTLVGTPHKLEPDLDNLLKALNDSFCKNDSSIHSIVAYKLWNEEGKILITNFEENG